MLTANGPSIRRQQAIECRIALCSANQHQTDAVPFSWRGSASRNLLPTNLLAGELEKDAPASTSTATNRLTHSNTSPHLGQPFFQKQFFTPRYSQIYRTNHDPFTLAWHLQVKACGTRSERPTQSNVDWRFPIVPFVALCTARRRSQESRAIKRYRFVIRVTSRSWSAAADQRLDQLRMAFAAAPSGAADAVTACRSIGDRFIAFSNTRFSILVFEYSFSKPCSNIFEYSNNRFSTVERSTTTKM